MSRYRSSDVRGGARRWLAERGWHVAPPMARDLDAVRAEIDEELRFHIDEVARALQRDEGLPPHEAFAEALVRFGDLEQVRRACVRQRIGETVMIQRLHFLLTLALGLIALGSVATLVVQHRRADAAADAMHTLGAELAELRSAFALEQRVAATTPERRDFGTLAVGDQIRVRSGNAPHQFDDRVHVARDGKALFRHLGWVDAAGRTLASLELALEEAYEPFSVTAPAITLFLERAALARAEIEDPLIIAVGDEISLRSTGQPGALDQLARVAEDGTIWLPVIGRVRVVGMSRDELERLLSERYRPFYTDRLGLNVICHPAKDLVPPRPAAPRSGRR